MPRINFPICLEVRVGKREELRLYLADRQGMTLGMKVFEVLFFCPPLPLPAPCLLFLAPTWDPGRIHLVPVQRKRKVMMVERHKRGVKICKA